MAEETPAGHGAYFVNSGGEVVPVPDTGISQAQAMGWVPASLEQVKDVQLQAKFGTAGQQALSGLEGFGDALTLGASTQAETALGVDPENIKGREEANAGAHALGTGVGIIAPALLTEGGSLAETGAGRALGSAAELSAPSLVGKVGHAAEQGVKAMLPEATGVLGKAATKAAGTAAAGVAEGGLYGLGHVIHEEALGDPNLTASSALEEIGLSGLFGGGLGAAGGALGQLTKEAVGGKLGTKLAEWLPDFEAERNIKAAGGIQSDINQALKRTSKAELNKMALEARDLGILGRFSTPGKVLERSESVMDAAGAKMGDILDEAEAAGVRPPPFEKVAQRIQDDVLSDMEKVPFQRPAAQKIARVLDQYAEGQADTLTLKDLHNIRKQFDKELYGLRGQLDPEANYYKAGLHEARSILSDEINQSLKQGGMASEGWKQANREYQVASTMQKFAEKGLQRLHGNNLVSPTELLSGLAGGVMHGAPGGLALGLATAAARRYGSALLGAGARSLRGFLEKDAAAEAAGKTAELVAAERQAGSDTIAQGAAHMPESVAALSQLEKANQDVAARVNSLMSKVLVGAGKATRALAAKAASEKAASTEELVGHIQHLAQSPETLQQRLEAQAGDVMDHAPQTAQALQVASARAVAFLATKAPQMPKLGPLGPKFKMDAAAKWKFGRYYDAVHKPTGILHHAAAGTLTPMDVEAVATVHPALFAHMKSVALDRLTSHEGPVPYTQRMMLSMLLGTSVDGSMTPQAILANQITFALPSSKSGDDVAAPRPKSTQSGLAKLDLASQNQLPSQAAETRRRQVG